MQLRAKRHLAKRFGLFEQRTGAFVVALIFEGQSEGVEIVAVLLGLFLHRLLAQQDAQLFDALFAHAFDFVRLALGVENIF